MEQILERLTTESLWIAPSLASAAGAGLLQLRGQGQVDHRRTAAAMSMFAGVFIGMLAFGHLLAVTLKLAMGTLAASTVVAYAIGVVLLVPSVVVVAHAIRMRRGEADVGRPTAAANGLLAGALLVTGPLNLPLAILPLLNVGHGLAERRWTRRAFAGAVLLVGALLFVGSVRFFLSGGSFEEFGGS